VPHDLAPPATAALELAIELARAHGGNVRVLTVLEPVASIAGISPPGHPVWIPSPEDVASVRSELEQIVALVCGRSGTPAVRVDVAVGEPLEQIMRAAERADAIVMATHGRVGVAHLVIGSLSEKVVRHAPCPVLTVRCAPARRTRERSASVRRARTRLQRGGRHAGT